MARAKALYLARHPETAKGQAQAEGNKRARGLSARSAVRPDAPSYVAAASAKTGKSERTVETASRNPSKFGGVTAVAIPWHAERATDAVEHAPRPCEAASPSGWAVGACGVETRA
mgnify:CR=1 FL=1